MLFSSSSRSILPRPNPERPNPLSKLGIISTVSTFDKSSVLSESSRLRVAPKITKKQKKKKKININTLNNFNIK